MNEEEQLLTTGRVIDATRKIESTLVACGAVGSGLREKAESLGDRLPAEAARLIRFIGSVRNRFAHESGARLRPDELELFEEAAEAVLAELDSLPEPVPPEKKPSAARRKTVRTPAVPEVEDDGGGENDEDAGALPETAVALPPWDSPIWTALPGLHLVYAFRAGWNAFGAGQLYLLLILAELIAFVLLGFAAVRGSMPLAAAGGVLGFAVYVCGLWLGLREKSGPGLYLVPAVNLAWFFRKVAACIEPARLIVAAAILGIWLAAVQLLLYGEFAAAGIAALVSWSGAAADSLLRRS